MANIPSSSNQLTSSQHNLAQMAMSKLCLGGEIIKIPTALVENEELFREIIKKDAYKNLTVESKNYLKRFFPKNYDANDEEQILDGIFSSDPTFHFGNTILKMHSKLKAGFFDPDRSSELNNNRKVLYDHYIRHYYMSLLKKLLISRHAILEQACSIGPNDSIEADPFRFQIVKKKASKRAIQDRNIVVEKVLDRREKMIQKNFYFTIFRIEDIFIENFIKMI